MYIVPVLPCDAPGRRGVVVLLLVTTTGTRGRGWERGAGKGAAGLARTVLGSGASYERVALPPAGCARLSQSQCLTVVPLPDPDWHNQGHVFGNTNNSNTSTKSFGNR